jgi:DNA repair protein RecO (recombination protein O)
MLESTRGIVLRTTRYSESSLIVRLYTEKMGLLSAMAKGVRSAKSRNRAALLQAPNLLELVIYHKPGRNLQHLREIRMQRMLPNIASHIARSTSALFIVELLNKALLEDDPNPGLYEYLEESLIALDRTESGLGCFPQLFMCGLARHLGFAPDNSAYVKGARFDLSEGHFTRTPSARQLDEGSAEALAVLLQSRYEDLAAIHLNGEQRRKLLDGLIDYYRLHLEHFSPMHSPQILEAVLRG